MIIMIFLMMFQNYSETDYAKEILRTQSIQRVEEISGESLKLFPDSYILNLNTAYKYFLMKKYKKAYPFYKKAYKIYPSLNPLLGLTYTQVELKKYDELLNITDNYKYQSLENEKYIYLRRSYAYLILEKYDFAILEANTGLEKYPNFKDLILNRNYALQMKPKLEFNLIPVWGMINYSNHETKTSYDYFGGLLYLNYAAYSFDLGAFQGNVYEASETKTEYSFDIGLGYNDNYNIYIHFKKIILDDEDGMIPYLHFGYNYDFMSIIGTFSISSYEFLDDLAFQIGFYSSFYFYDKKIIPTIFVGWKYLKKDGINSQPYIEFGLDFLVNKQIGINTSFRYNQHKYFVEYGGIADNSLDDIIWMAEIGFSLNWKGLIISPIYKYYHLEAIPEGFIGRRGQAPTVSKSFFTVLFGYHF